MKRNIIHIDEEKCDGCGLCIPGCREGALQIIDGKAKLVSEVYCDGLGECLGHCPQGALTVIEREAPEFSEEAVARHLAAQGEAPAPHAGGCPGSAVRTLNHGTGGCPGSSERHLTPPSPSPKASASSFSKLGHWPVQMMLVMPQAAFLKEADLLICADCAPFAYPDIHQHYLAGRAVLVGCPKLDRIEFYEEKMVEIFEVAKPRSVTILRMEVPCCGGLPQMVIRARNRAKAATPITIHTIGIEGHIINRENIV